ncbi:MAG TPA: GNAT family N-acetyltransferase [Vicinamibacterales bacterium]
MFVLRPMTPDDIPAGLRLCRASGWNQIEDDWQRFLTEAPHGALVAVLDGQVVGTVATLPYGPFTWVSMVLVDPAVRGRGIGTRLLEGGLALVPEGVTARLDATPAGEVLYRKLAFEGEYPLARLFLDVPPSGEVRDGSIRPLAADDWPQILEQDLPVFGASRAGLLRQLAEKAPEYAWVAEEGGRITGYMFGRHGHDREHLGPIVARSTDVAGALLDACLTRCPPRGLYLDVPDHQPAWLGRLSALGFTRQRTFLRMYRGVLASPGEPGSVFAVTGPEFG